MPILYSESLNRPLTCAEFDNNFREALKRENHTGTQSASTISDLDTAVDALQTVVDLKACCSTLGTRITTLENDLFGDGQLSSIIADLQAQLQNILNDIEGYLDTSSVINDIRNSVIPLGSIVPFTGENPPSSSWLLAQGQAISRTTYSELFGLYGTRYGLGDGVNTFNLPDLRAKVPVGAGLGYTLADEGGEATHQLTLEEMAQHSHPHTHRILARQNSGTEVDQFNIVSGSVQGSYSYKQTNDIGTNLIDSNVIDVGTVGGNVAHNNMQPYLVLNYIIKVR